MAQGLQPDLALFYASFCYCFRINLSTETGFERWKRTRLRMTCLLLGKTLRTTRSVLSGLRLFFSTVIATKLNFTLIFTSFSQCSHSLAITVMITKRAQNAPPPNQMTLSSGDHLSKVSFLLNLSPVFYPIYIHSSMKAIIFYSNDL